MEHQAHLQAWHFHWWIATAFTAGLVYLWAARRQLKLGKKWSMWRGASFSCGVLILCVAMAPSLVEFAHQDLRGHMMQHLLLGMFAPLALVLAAPLTLLLRTCGANAARGIVKFLEYSPLAFLAHPFCALVLNVGAMYLLYLSPLYSAGQNNSTLHTLIHIHFVIAGCLFTWSIAGPDPGPKRPSAGLRLLVLFISMAAHANLSKLMYAYHWPKGDYSLVEIQEAAKLMYYGGDVAELLLLVALLCLWGRKRSSGAAPLGSF